MFYIENFALRLLFCVGTLLVVVLVVGFIRASAAGAPFVFDPLKHLVLPAALGVVTTFLWRPRQKLRRRENAEVTQGALVNSHRNRLPSRPLIADVT